MRPSNLRFRLPKRKTKPHLISRQTQIPSQHNPIPTTIPSTNQDHNMIPLVYMRNKIIKDIPARILHQSKKRKPLLLRLPIHIINSLTRINIHICHLTIAIPENEKKYAEEI